MRNQVRNCVKNRISSSVRKISSENSEYYPIRREINEIFEPENRFIDETPKKLSFQESFSRISSIQTQKNALKTNKIMYIVDQNEKTLGDLAKHGKNFEGNPFKALLEAQKDFNVFAKMMCLHKSKYKNYSNCDPLNTCVKFDFNKFLHKKLKIFVENPVSDRGIFKNDGFLSERKERNEKINEGFGGQLTSRIRQKIKSKEKRAATALDCNRKIKNLRVDVKSNYMKN